MRAARGGETSRLVVTGQPARAGAHEPVQHGVAGSGVEREHVGEPGVLRQPGDVRHAAQVQQHARLGVGAEQPEVGDRHERRALAPGRGVAAAEVTHDRDARALGERRGRTQLKRERAATATRARDVAHGLAMRTDRRELPDRDTRLITDVGDGLGVELSQFGIEPHETLGLQRLGADDREHLVAQIIGERALEFGQHLVLRRQALALQAHQDRVDGVGRGPGHEPDDQVLGRTAVAAEGGERVAGHRGSGNGKGQRDFAWITSSVSAAMSASATGTRPAKASVKSESSFSSSSRHAGCTG